MPIGVRRRRASSTGRATLRSISRGGAPITMFSGLTSRWTIALGRRGSAAPRRRAARAAAPARAASGAVARRSARAASGPRGARAAGAGSGRRSRRRIRARSTGCASRSSASASRRELAQRARVARLVGPQHLRHQHGEPVVVPDEEDLVAPPAAELAQHGAAGRDLVALVEAPGRPRAARALPRRRLGDGRAGASARPSTGAGCRRRRRPAERAGALAAASRRAGRRRPARRGARGGAASASTTAAASGERRARRRALIGGGADRRRAPGRRGRGAVDGVAAAVVGGVGGTSPRATGNPVSRDSTTVSTPRVAAPCDPLAPTWSATPSTPASSRSPRLRC